MSKAWEIQAKTPTLSFGDCLRQSWAIVKANALKAALKMGIVYFSFIKADGTLRNAVGTMNLEYFTPLFITDKHKDKEITYTSAISYWDMELNTWRSYRVDRLQKIGKINIYNEVELSQRLAWAA